MAENDTTPEDGARLLISSWLRDLAGKVDDGEANLPEVYQALSGFLAGSEVRQTLTEYAVLRDPVETT